MLPKLSIGNLVVLQMKALNLCVGFPHDVLHYAEPDNIAALFETVPSSRDVF